MFKSIVSIKIKSTCLKEAPISSYYKKKINNKRSFLIPFTEKKKNHTGTN